jgi:hypothetical protein
LLGWWAGGAKSKRTGKARAGPAAARGLTRADTGTKRSPSPKFTGKGGAIGARRILPPGRRRPVFLRIVASSAAKSGASSAGNRSGRCSHPQRTTEAAPQGCARRRGNPRSRLETGGRWHPSLWRSDAAANQAAGRPEDGVPARRGAPGRIRHALSGVNRRKFPAASLDLLAQPRVVDATPALAPVALQPIEEDWFRRDRGAAGSVHAPAALRQADCDPVGGAITNTPVTRRVHQRFQQ